MSYTLDVLDANVFTVLGNFIASVTGLAPGQVVRVPNNRVPMPKTYPFVTMSPVFQEMIHRPVASVSDPLVQPQSATLSQAIRYQIQVDAFGPTAGDVMQQIHGVFESPDAFDFFAGQAIQGVYPIYANSPHQAPLVDAEDEYEIRWIMDISLQYNPSLTTSVQTASTVTVGATNVEASYH